MDKPCFHKVFYVLSWGYAGDHWFSWFAKALNAHPDVLSMMAHEGSRPKYIPERSRSERPDLLDYTAFLEDMGHLYAAIGDCWSYRPWHFRDRPELMEQLPILFLVRHPYVWLDFYVRWRAGNLRTVTGSSGPLDHEWNISQHQYFSELGLRPYAREEVEVWASYQGMFQMNRHAVDIPSAIRRERLEDMVACRRSFEDVFAWLVRGRCAWPESLLDEVWSWRWKAFDGEEELRLTPADAHAAWPDWKQEAFDRIVQPETRDFYAGFGYEF